MFRRSIERGVTVLLAAAWLHAAPPAEQKERPKLAPELEPVFAMAMAAPPEFAARALLRLDSRVTDKSLRQELVEMAFRLAAKAQSPVPLIPFPGTEVDTRAGSVGGASRLKLDVLSLQSRAVQDMAAVNAARARELFTAMPQPASSSPGCEGGLLPDVAPYYEALAAMQGSFSAAERAKDAHVTFTTAAVGRISALSELGPAARMLLSLDWPAAQFKIVLDAFTAKLTAMPLDSRSFLYFSKTIDNAMGLLVPRARQLGLPTSRLSEVYRRFLVAQFRGPHCADTGMGPGVMFLPSSLFGPSIRGELEPITDNETVPELYAGSMKLERYWQTGEAERLYQTCWALREGPQGDPIPDSSRRLREWSNQVSAFLNGLVNWSTGDMELERDYFHQKARVHEALLQAVPEGEIGDRVIDSFMELLKSSNVQRRNAPEWFWRAYSMVDAMRPKHPAHSAKLLAAYRASGNIILMLESMLDQVAPSNL